MLTFQLLVKAEGRFEDFGAHRQAFAVAQLLLGIMHEVDQTFGELLALVVLERIADYAAQSVSGSLEKILLVDEGELAFAGR